MDVFKRKFKKQYLIGILGILIISDMWSVDKRYLNETHFVNQVNISIKLLHRKDIHKSIYQRNNKNQSRVFNYNNHLMKVQLLIFIILLVDIIRSELLKYKLIDNHLSKG